MDFDTLVTKVLRREGGYVNNPADRGGETNFGISKRANPDVDIKGLTEAKAREIYRDRYWTPLGADRLPENMRDLAFDTAVHHGVGRAKQWVAASKNNPSKLLALRKAALEKQAKQPGQEQFARGWINRLSEFATEPGSGPAPAPRQTARQRVLEIATGRPSQEPAAPVVEAPVAPRVNAAIRGPLTAVEAATRAEGTAARLAAGIEVGEFEQRIQEDIKPTTLERFGAAMAGNMDQRGFKALIGLTKPEFEPDPKWQVPWDKVNNLPRDVGSDLAESRSQAEFDAKMADIEEDAERTRTIMSGGTVSGVALMFAGEATSLSAYLAPAAAMRAASGRIALAAATGQRAKALGIGAATGATADAGLELAVQAIEGDADLKTAVLAGTVGAMFGGLDAALITRGLNRIQPSIEEAANERGIKVADAIDKLGDTATPQQVLDEIKRAETAEIKQPLSEALTAVREERKFFDSPDLEDADQPNSASSGQAVDAESISGPSPATTDIPVRQALELALDSPAVKFDTVDARASKSLIEHLRNVLPASILDNVPVRFIGPWQQGSYFPRSASIETPGTSADALTKPAGAAFDEASTLGHEVVHAATYHVIRAAFANDPGITQGVKDAVSRLDEIRLELWEHLRKEGKRDTKVEWGANYAAKNLDEFVAQVMSDGETRSVLAKMPGGKFKDLLNDFADAIVRLLGLDPKTNDSALKEAIALVDRVIKEGHGAPSTGAPVRGPSPEPQVDALMADPVAAKYGLTVLPTGTPVERADAQMMLNLYKKAEAWSAKNPMDEAWVKRADQLIDNSLLPAASTGLRLLKSKNPVARMMAAELLEDASGVAGKRRSTAAISKYMNERAFMGNALPVYNDAYAMWRKAQGGTIWSDVTGRDFRDRFDRLIAEETEYRRITGKPVSDNPYVKAATDAMQGAYNRIRIAQQQNKTLGWQALPDSSVGYMPHKISPNKWLSLSNDQRQAVQQALTDQFINIEGWDMTFSDQLAARYLARVQARATNGHDSPIGGASAGSAEIVEDAMLAMGMSREEVRKNMQRFNRGAAGWTKGRLDIDLNKGYEVNGQELKLLDVFDTDQVSLLRSQAGRASGEVALARHGIYGRPHMEVIRKAMTQPDASLRITDAEADAFDQVAAEFINAPFGTAEPKWLENARVLNSAVRLGGIVYNQFAEFVNAVAHVGVVRTIAGVASMGRMRSEIKALVRGKAVDNPLLLSIEKMGGAEFGTDAYRIVMPFDVPDHAYPTYGVDTVTTFDRLVRGASYAQGKLSLWRTVHSVQQRAMAEQIVAKIGRYANNGGEDIALRQFGISPELQAAIKRDGVARYENGSLVEFDVNKLADSSQREELIQAVHRGVSQIIQGTFIGETGKWAHSGYLKMLVQFRTFSLTSMEKQWARQRNSRGAIPTLGILLTSMMAVAPIYMARVYAQSIGREDQEEFIEQRLQPEMIARQTLNYVALAGLTGDLLDAAVALAPDELGLQVTGGRAGNDTEFVGNIVAPAASLVDDVWKALQNLDDPEQLLKVLPGSRLPYILPAINSLGE